MCDMCRNEENGPTAARPLNKYDVAVLIFGSAYNMALVVLEFFSALVQMTRYQASMEAKHAEAWAKISQDLEKLEAQDG